MRTWSEIPTLEERLRLLYDVLNFIKRNPTLTTEGARERIARTFNLTPYTVKRILDFLWFSDLIRTEYRGFPARVFYVVTDKGERVLARGRLEGGDFAEAPEWVWRTIKRRAVVVVKRELTVSIKEFTFLLREDWNYKVIVRTPLEWLRPWEVDKWGKEYSVKVRAIMLLQTFAVAPNYFAGYSWEMLSPEEIKRRMQYGRLPARWRTMRLDPYDLIVVRKISEDETGITWEVDFTAFKDKLPTMLNLAEIKSLAEERGYSTA
ncbi:MAG TPA: hypothetical protein ENG66_03800 [Thermococcus sp.]|nr:hypothetical protein [Thermococcus sp.]